MKLSQRQIQHLYWRAGFGIAPGHLERISNKSQGEIIAELFDKSQEFRPIDMDLKKFMVDRKKLSKEQKKKLRSDANKSMLEMNLLWLKEMSSTEAVLREKLAFFFHDHFAVRLKNPVLNLELINIIRENALGSFAEMLMKVSKTPAMILFLNNQQNKKSHPNENFAREVMELFTLGRDNGYSEEDIKEAARAFTGWKANKLGEFQFNEKQHDNGQKTILGRTGNFKGEDVIDILLEEKQTARYLTEKLVNFLISRKVDQSTIETFTDEFYGSDYDLSVLVKSILESTAFFDEKSIGCRIKSPTELLVGINSLITIDYKEPKAIIQVQRKLNQVLFFPPNVAGWEGGKGWIDSSTLMLRMKIPSLILNFGVIEWLDESELSENMNIRLKKQQEKIKERIEKRVKAYPDWKKLERDIKPQLARLEAYLLQVDAAIDLDETDETKDRIIQILSLPEYQLC